MNIHTKYNSFLSFISLLLLLVISGCGSTSSSVTMQEVFFSDYRMEIGSSFVSLDPSGITDRRLHWNMLASYSMPTSLDNVFEKNIIVMEDTLWSLDIQSYVDQSIEGIQKTWWWYTKISLTKDEILCGATSLPAIQHNFTIMRWWFNQTGQTIYFMQYFFAKNNKIVILSSSTDIKSDLDVLEEYKNTISCVTWSGNTTIIE